MKFFARLNTQIRLRTKMLMLFGVLGLLIMLLSWLVSLYGVPLLGINGTSDNIREREEKQLQLVTAYKKELLKVWLVGNHNEIERFANHPVINRVVDDIVEGKDAQAQQAWLQHRIEYFVDSSFFQDGVIIVAQDKGVLAQSGIGDLDTQMLEQVLERALENPNQIGIQAHQGGDYADSGVYFTCAIHVPGSPDTRAALITFSSLNHVIYNILHNTQGLGQSANVYLLNDQAEKLWHFSAGPAAQRAVEALSVPEAPLLKRLNASGLAAESIGQPIRLADAHGNMITAVLQPVPVDAATTWYLVVQQDNAQVRAAMLQHIRIAIIVGLLFVAPVFGAIFLISRQLTRPLQRFSHDAARVLQGDLQVRARPGSSVEEVQLASVFNSMVEHIASWHEELESQVAQKTAALHQTQQQRAGVAELQERYLELGQAAPVLDMLVELLLKFTGADMGQFYQKNHPEEQYTAQKNFTDCYTCVTAPEKAHVFNSQCRADFSGIIPAEKLLKTLTQAHVLQVEEKTETILVDVPPGVGPQSAQVLLVPVARAHTTFGLIVLLSCRGAFPDDVKEVAAMFAAATALIMDADRRDFARRAAEEDARLKGKFLANMSHELRTPMNVVIGMNGLLQETELDEKQYNYVSKIAISSRHLLTLINDILDVSRFESGHTLSFSKQVFSVDEMLDDVVSLHVYSIDETRVEMHVDVAPDVPRSLIGDGQRLEQILNNLVGNAVKFTESGDIVLRVELEHSDAHQVSLLFQVQDTGLGISSEQQERMFMPFEQADMSRTRKYGGTGLGLTISTELCSMMGGELWLESEEGKGSTFYVRMPFDLAADAGAVPREHQVYPEVENQRVLVVDDNPLGLQITAGILERMHLRADTAASAHTALTNLHHAVEDKDPYTLVVADASMPDMGGLALAREIHARPGSYIPKVVVLCQPRQYERYASMNPDIVDALCVKPVRASALFDAISEAFGYPVGHSHGGCTTAYMWKGTRILLAEDNELNRQVAHELLERVGIEVIDAVNGAEAVALTQQEDVDLILMDIQMPVMDGLAACRAIRAHSDARIRSIPIVAMTAGAFEKDRNETRAAGMDEHISKPVDPVMLDTVLERVLPEEKRQQVDAPAAQRCSRECSPALSPSFVSSSGTSANVNVDRGLGFAAGDWNAYLRRLQGFAEHFAPALAILEPGGNAASINATDTLLHVLHDLKSAAASIGADELQRSSSKCEQLLKSDSSTDVRTLLRRVQEQLQHVLEYCRNFPDGADAAGSDPDLSIAQDSPNVSLAETTDVAQMLEQLINALQHHQVHECKRLSDLLYAALVNDAMLSEEITRLGENIHKYRYAQALDHACQIHKHIGMVTI